MKPRKLLFLALVTLLIIATAAVTLVVLWPAPETLDGDVASKTSSPKGTADLLDSAPVSERSVMPQSSGVPGTFSSTQKQIAQFAKIFRLGDPLERRLRFLKLVRGLSPEDLLGLLAFLSDAGESGLNIRQKAELHGLFLDRLSQIDAAAAGKRALEALAEGTGAQMSPLQGRIHQYFHRWAREDPSAALAAAWETLPAALATETQRSVLRSLAMSGNPQKAYELLKDGPPDHADTRLYREIFHHWYQQDPETAAREALTAPVSRADNARLFFIREFGTRWANQDRDAALNWVRNLQNDWDRGHILEGIVQSWGRTAPSEAAAWVEQQPHDDLQIQRAIRKVAQGWMENDYDAAVEWAIPRLEENFARNLLVEQVSQDYYQRDPQRAADFIESMPPSPSRDAGVRKILELVGDADLSAAFQWAGVLSQEADRQLQMLKTARQWLKQDADAARQAIRTSDLPRQVKNELLDENS